MTLILQGSTIKIFTIAHTESNSQQKSAAVVYRAGTKHGPSFDLKDESVDEGNFCLSIIYLSFTTVFSMYS